MNYAATVSIRDTHRWIVEKKRVAIKAGSPAAASAKALHAVMETLKPRTQVRETSVHLLAIRAPRIKNDEDDE